MKLICTKVVVEEVKGVVDVIEKNIITFLERCHIIKLRSALSLISMVPMHLFFAFNDWRAHPLFLSSIYLSQGTLKLSHCWTVNHFKFWPAEPRSHTIEPVGLWPKRGLTHHFIWHKQNEYHPLLYGPSLASVILIK
jgi:hypothetical protein